LDPHDGVVGVIGGASLRVEEAELPLPEPSVDPSPCDDRHGRAARVEADAARIEQLHPARRAQVELAARFEKNSRFSGKKKGNRVRLMTCWSASTCAKSVWTVTSAVNVGVTASLASTPAFPFR